MSNVLQNNGVIAPRDLPHRTRKIEALEIGEYHEEPLGVDNKNYRTCSVTIGYVKKKNKGKNFQLGKNEKMVFVHRVT